MSGTLGSGGVYTKQRKIAALAERVEGPLTSINQVIDKEWMLEAWRRTRKDGAAGVDKKTRVDFEADLDANLATLLDEAKAGTYFAPPGRRAYIPKGDSQRPIAVPCLGDKVLQRAVTMALEPILEGKFYDCSYGFRPGRSAHQACGRIRHILMGMNGGYVVEADIRSFFDTLSRSDLRAFLSEWIVDGVIRKLIDKWLNAGVLEGDQLTRPAEGSVQGGVISPCLANLYLHFVLDQWFHEVARAHLRGKAELVRFADDFVIICEYREDATRLLQTLHKRFARFNLTLHPEKTRIVPFIKPPRSATRIDGRYTRSFDFLGFTFLWSRSRKGKWIIKMRTAKDRFSRGLDRANEWCKRNRHRRIDDQYRVLMRKIRGHQAYFRVRGNSARAGAFQYEVLKVWRKWLNRAPGKDT